MIKLSAGEWEGGSRTKVKGGAFKRVFVRTGGYEPGPDCLDSLEALSGESRWLWLSPFADDPPFRLSPSGDAA